jgi:hypothetical protein
MTKLYSDLYRTCMTCGEEKSILEFYFRDKKTGRRHWNNNGNNDIINNEVLQKRS